MGIDRQWIAAAVAIVAAASPLAAQRTEGITASFGIAYGSVSTSVSNSDGDHASGTGGGTAGSIVLGYAFDEQWRVALEFDQVNVANFPLAQIGNDGDVIMSLYTASLAYYPGRRSSFWVRANLGFGREHLGFSAGNGNSIGGGAVGFAAGLGVGYDWRFGKSPFFAIPYVSYLSIFNTSDFGGDFSGTGTRGYGNLLQVGVGIGFGN